MKRLIEFPMAEGGSIIVEVEGTEQAGGMERAARPGEVAEHAKESFEKALDKIRPAMEIVVSKLHDLTQSPNEISVECGIKFSAKAGAFLASADSEATFKVTLKWKSETPKDGHGPS